MNEDLTRLLKTNQITHAVFDIDNTLSRTNSVIVYYWIKGFLSKHTLLYYLWSIYFFLICCPYYLILDFVNRDYFQHAFMKRFSEFNTDELDYALDNYFDRYVTKHLITPCASLLTYFNNAGIKVSLCSLSIDLLVKRYASYFNVNSFGASITLHKKNGFYEPDFSKLKNFKLNYTSRYVSDRLVVIADSKHDLPILQYANHSIIVANKNKKWFNQVKNHYILNY